LKWDKDRVITYKNEISGQGIILDIGEKRPFNNALGFSTMGFRKHGKGQGIDKMEVEYSTYDYV